MAVLAILAMMLGIKANTHNLVSILERWRPILKQKETNMRLIATALLLLLTLELAQAGDRDRKRKESRNYIIERQQAGQVTGVPILRRIRGSREIDIYRDGSMFEKHHFVGFSKR